MENNFHEVDGVYYLRFLSTDTKEGRSYFSRGKGLRCSVMLSDMDCYLVTDVSEQHIGSIFKGRSC